ncbi:hypothetical protein F5X96DRAFT_502486 [Biscogniauxia mediterranea]|nr:hypothetical protein F5X96DRAFT_502486 [Biscogniauxia mediterranea]
MRVTNASIIVRKHLALLLDWDCRTGARRYTTSDVHSNSITSLAFPHEGIHLISVFVGNIVFVWGIMSMKFPKYRFQGHTNWLRDAAISSNGHLVAIESRMIVRFGSGTFALTAKMWKTTALAMCRLACSKATLTRYVYSNSLLAW